MKPLTDKKELKQTNGLEPMPKNEEAEIALLGSILLEGDKIFEKAKSIIKDSGAFYTSKHQELWNSFNRLYKNNVPIDTVTVFGDIKDNVKDHTLTTYYLTGLADGVPTTANCETYAKNIWYKFIQRKAVKSSQILYNLTLQNTDDIVEVLHHHEKIIQELKDIAPSKIVKTEDILTNTVEALKEGSNLIPFGIEQLDNAAGGMTRGEITVVGGRPGHGKTTMVINIVKRLLEQGKKVMLFNREMTNVEMMKKILVMEFQEFSYEKIRKASNIDKEITEINLKKEELGEKYKNLIMLDDCKTLADAMKEISKEKPDVVLDDYIQLIRTDNSKNKDRRFEIEDIMLDYKWICKKIKCSAILVSQLNREIERRLDPRPKLSDFAESGVIEQTAEAAFFVYYPYAVDDRDNDRYEIEIICQKARYGKLGSYNMGFNGDKCSVYFDRTEAIQMMNK
jgi:replicative DNA helicase